MSPVAAHILPYGKARGKPIPINCPTCHAALAEKGKEVACLQCGLRADWLVVYRIPDEHTRPWIEIFYWHEPGQEGWKLHIRPFRGMKQDELDDVREGVIRPLVQTWNRRLVAQGFMKPEETSTYERILLGVDPPPAKEG